MTFALKWSVAVRIKCLWFIVWSLNIDCVYSIYIYFVWNGFASLIMRRAKTCVIIFGGRFCAWKREQTKINRNEDNIHLTSKQYWTCIKIMSFSCWISKLFTLLCSSKRSLITAGAQQWKWSIFWLFFFSVVVVAFLLSCFAKIGIQKKTKKARYETQDETASRQSTWNASHFCVLVCFVRLLR